MSWEKRLLVLFALGCFFVGMFVIVNQAYGRPPIPPHVFVAIRANWTERADRIKAFDVAWCESRYSTTAVSGEYLGLFQMGAWARARYGHSGSARAQARAAWLYWRESGWSGWSCA